MPYNHKITGQILRGLREKKGVTQEVLSGLAALSRSHLAEIERGTTRANVDTLWRICEALGIPLSELFRLVEEELQRNGPQ